MTKKTSGPGWAFVPAGGPQPSKGLNPGSPKPKIQVQKRAGKKVTVVTGLHTYGDDRLNEIARDLKSVLGTGGTVKNGAIEIQGDKVLQIQAYFERSKFKGS